MVLVRTLEGSLSPVSTPILASKYAFFSIFRDLQSPLSGGRKVLALFVRPIGAAVDLEKMQQNAYLDAKIGVDTEENGPSKVLGSKMRIW